MPRVKARRLTTFSALGQHHFRVFWIGLLVSLSGNAIQLFALGWLVVQLAVRDGAPERASLYLGLVGLSRALPGLVLGLIGGVLVDRFDRRSFLFVTESCASVVAVVLAVLTLTDTVTLGWVLALSAVGSVTLSLGALLRQAIVPRLAGPEHLVSAVGLNSTAINLSSLIGPVLGGVLIGTVGIGGLMLVNAASYLAVLLSLLLVPAQPSLATEPRGGLLASIREGFAYVRATPFVRWQLFLFGAGVLLGRPYAELMPAFVHDALRLGAVELSWVIAAGGAGGLLATLVAASLGSVRGRGLVFIGATLGAGLSLGLFGAQHSLAAALVFVVPVAFTMILAATLSMTLIQVATPDHLRGRVIGLQMLIVQTGVPAGALLLGALGTVIGIDTAITVGGLALVLVGAFVLVRAPVLRGRQHREAIS
jgi:predicted MFS family arabinose efflux permease